MFILQYADTFNLRNRLFSQVFIHNKKTAFVKADCQGVALRSLGSKAEPHVASSIYTPAPQLEPRNNQTLQF